MWTSPHTHTLTSARIHTSFYCSLHDLILYFLKMISLLFRGYFYRIMCFHNLHDCTFISATTLQMCSVATLHCPIALFRFPEVGLLPPAVASYTCWIKYASWCIEKRFLAFCFTRLWISVSYFIKHVGSWCVLFCSYGMLIRDEYISWYFCVYYKTEWEKNECVTITQLTRKSKSANAFMFTSA